MAGIFIVPYAGCLFETVQGLFEHPYYVFTVKKFGRERDKNGLGLIKVGIKKSVLDIKFGHKKVVPDKNCQEHFERTGVGTWGEDLVVDHRFCEVAHDYESCFVFVVIALCIYFLYKFNFAGGDLCARREITAEYSNTGTKVDEVLELNF